uniref:DUF4939 domain-containing protein n=1 Tax=Terrapene triunguis TaxID=2587831 RepID=A0A674JXA3_9SAUR
GSALEVLLAQEQVRQLNTENAMLCTSPAVPCPKQGPVIPMPEWLDGKHQWFWVFMNQCRLLLLMPRIYASYQSKVTMVISLLMGDTLDWTSPLLEGHSLALSNWDAFLQSISTIFNYLHRV